MSGTLGSRVQGLDLPREVERHYQMVLEEPWARVRNLRENGWKPEIAVEGMDWLDAGQAAGAGTVLWRMPFGSTLTIKAGLWQQGVPLVHLSDRHHGALAKVWTSRKILCPLFRRAENWFLTERVIIPADGSTIGVMKTLLSRLKNDNAVVSIVAFSLGTQVTWIPFFDGWIGLAIGAPALAWRAGSTLLPVYAVREGTGRFRVVIEEPIPVDRGLHRKVFVRKATEEYVERMQNAIQRFPGSWGHWGGFWSGSGVYQTQTNVPREEG